MNIEQARFNMIEQQIRPWDVPNQEVLALISNTPRELFVPEAYQHLAFSDTNIPLPHDQVMMSPKLEARMLQALNVQADDQVLEIGTGSGYVTALLASQSSHVRSEEIHADLSAQAQVILEMRAINNIELVVTDSLRKRDLFQRFDVIAITGSMPIFDPGFQQQLEVGGRLFVIVGETPVMEAKLITRISEREWQEESLFETDLLALIGSQQPDKFIF